VTYVTAQRFCASYGCPKFNTARRGQGGTMTTFTTSATSIIVPACRVALGVIFGLALGVLLVAASTVV
jgi:hypothetical protein